MTDPDPVGVGDGEVLAVVVRVEEEKDDTDRVGLGERRVEGEGVALKDPLSLLGEGLPVEDMEVEVEMVGKEEKDMDKMDVEVTRPLPAPLAETLPLPQALLLPEALGEDETEEEVIEEGYVVPLDDRVARELGVSRKDRVGRGDREVKGVGELQQLLVVVGEFEAEREALGVGLEVPDSEDEALVEKEGHGVRV